MKRKKFIAIAAATAAAVPLGYYGYQKSKKVYNQVNFPAMLAQFCSAEELKGIGSAYLQTVPDERDAEKLKSLLLAGISAQKITSSNANEHLNKKTEEDFLKENVKVLNQWVITHTEARQCALFSLTYK
jgi:hypothetical protein